MGLLGVIHFFLGDLGLLEPIQVDVKFLPIPLCVFLGGKGQFELAIIRFMGEADCLGRRKGAPPECRGDVGTRWDDVFMGILDLQVLEDVFLNGVTMVDDAHGHSLFPKGSIPLMFLVYPRSP